MLHRNELQRKWNQYINITTEKKEFENVINKMPPIMSRPPFVKAGCLQKGHYGTVYARGCYKHNMIEGAPQKYALSSRFVKFCCGLVLVNFTHTNQ